MCMCSKSPYIHINLRWLRPVKDGASLAVRFATTGLAHRRALSRRLAPLHPTPPTPRGAPPQMPGAGATGLSPRPAGTQQLRVLLQPRLLVVRAEDLDGPLDDVARQEAVRWLTDGAVLQSCLGRFRYGLGPCEVEK